MSASVTFTVGTSTELPDSSRDTYKTNLVNTINYPITYNVATSDVTLVVVPTQVTATILAPSAAAAVQIAYALNSLTLEQVAALLGISVTSAEASSGQTQVGTSGAAVSAGDPHLTFGHGGKADFRGIDNGIFNFLSAKGINVNIKTQDATFMLKDTKVHGSFITEAHIVVKDDETRRFLNVSYWASEIRENNWGWKVVNGTCGTRKFVLGPLAQKDCDQTGIRTDYSSALIHTPEWDVRISSKPVYDRIDGPHYRLDVRIVPTVAEDSLAVHPHGIIGQSFDGDALAIDGKQDVYEGAEMTTSAMAEGAIEGVWKDYLMDSKYSTDFKYSRFGGRINRRRSLVGLNKPRMLGGFQAATSEN